MKDEALKLALEALGWTDEWRPQGLKEEAITAIKQALAAPVQEPLGYVYEAYCLPEGACEMEWVESFDRHEPDAAENIRNVTPVHTTSTAQRQWVGLTDEEIHLFINGRGDEDDDDYVEPTGDGFGLTDADLVKLVRRAEAKLKEKNNG